MKLKDIKDKELYNHIRDLICYYAWNECVNQLFGQYSYPVYSPIMSLVRNPIENIKRTLRPLLDVTNET